MAEQIDETPELVLFLKKYCTKQLPSDSELFNVLDYCGNNIDDAFELGFLAGEKALAQVIVDIFYYNIDLNKVK